MPRTALAHFSEDLARARAIVAHADPLPQTTESEGLLRSDLLRGAWMFAVGALDAYFCDAYPMSSPRRSSPRAVTRR
jgi:hypothetical protein